VPKHLEGSAFALDQAIGPYRAALANLLGCSVDTLDLWTTPPPGFTPQAARNRGRRNPLDELHAIARHCPQGLDALRFLATALGHDLVARHAPPEPGQLPFADITLVVAAVEKLATELRRRKPKLTDDALRHLGTSIAHSIHALIERQIARRNRKREHRD